MGANASLMLILADRLELRLFGLLVTSIGGQLLLSRVLMLGVDRGVIRLRTLPELHDQTRELVNAGLTVIWRMSALLILTAIVLVLVLRLSASSLAPDWRGWMIATVVGGAIGTALVDYSYGVYLSRIRYRAAALLQGATALGRLAATTLAALIWPRHPLVSFLVYSGATLASGLAQAIFVFPHRHRGESRSDWALGRRLLRYSLWQGGTNFIGLLNLYQGAFLLTWLGENAAAGAFGLGLTLSMGFFAVYVAYGEYLLPRIARLESLEALPAFLTRAFGGALILVVGSIPVVVFVALIVARMLKQELSEITTVFYCLSASMLLLVCQSPLEVACHYLLRPQIGMLSWTLRVIYVGGLALMLAPSWGAWGAAVAQLGGAVLALLSLGMFVIYALRSARRKNLAVRTMTAPSAVLD
jgi:O-antigen/teichoic acid export membrane protein